MEVTRGYKQTEVGLIPEDWDVSLIKAIGVVEGGFAFSSKKFLQAGRYQVIKMSNLYGGKLDLQRSASYLDDLSEQEKHYLLKSSDILITLTGTTGKRDYGYSHKISDEQNLLLNQRVGRLRVDKNVIAGYVFFQIQTASFLDQFFDVTKGGTGNQANVGTHDIEELVIPLPPKAEQQAIAEALSDADALIESLEQLIQKKRLIKQGSMQELLTGKKRLPGFSGEWEIKELQDISEIDSESIGSSTRPDYQFKYIALEEVDRGTLRGWTEQLFATAPSRARRKIRKGDVIVSTVRPTLQSHCLIHSDFDDLVCSTGFSVIRCKRGIAEPQYIFSHFFASFIERQIEALLTGSNYPAINSTDVKRLKIPIPPTFSEQTAIAAVLSDMDAELAGLERKLEKVRQLKQGMMHTLLTGKIRLV